MPRSASDLVVDVLVIGDGLRRDPLLARALRELGDMEAASVSAAAVSSSSRLRDVLRTASPLVVALAGRQTLRTLSVPDDRRRLFLLELPGVMVHAVAVTHPGEVVTAADMRRLRSDFCAVRRAVLDLRGVFF